MNVIFMYTKKLHAEKKKSTTYKDAQHKNATKMYKQIFLRIHIKQAVNIYTRKHGSLLASQVRCDMIMVHEI